MQPNPVKALIRLRGVHQNNLKHLDLDLPLRQLIVVSGLSGSGKSSLAFDTLFAEGQRRYVETFSPYARQFLDRMDKPQVDAIEGIPPAIAIEQRNSVKSTRSTVGTMTEICDYAKVFWPSVAQLYCKHCGRLVQKDSPQRIWQAVRESNLDAEALVTFDLPLSEKFSLGESLDLISRQGYQRLLIDSEIVRVDAAVDLLRQSGSGRVTVVQDRLSPLDRPRFVEACEQAYHFGRGTLAVRWLNKTGAPGPAIQQTRLFSNRMQCADCNLEYREPSGALFSFNHPLGACPACRGFGRIITIDFDAALPDRTRTLAQGVVKPWQSGVSAECQEDMLKFARLRKAPLNVPFQDLPKKWQDWLIEGDPDYGKDKAHEWPRAWYGVKGYFRWLESKSYKMHVRVLLSRYRAYKTCPDCHGARFQPESLLYRAGSVDSPFALQDWLREITRNIPSLNNSAMEHGLSLADFYQLPVRHAIQFVERILSVRKSESVSDPVTLALRETHSRLAYLQEVGLGYLSLDRNTRSLSGGETERVNLTTCLGSRLVNTLFVLDEPSVGLHPRDTERLIRILRHLRDAGNTVVVVEHEASVIRAADHVVELGPGHGESGGEIVFQGNIQELLRDPRSLTGRYLSGRKRIELPHRRPIAKGAKLLLRRAKLYNLKDLTIEFPLGRFVCVSGVSGSGKSTLVREVLLPALEKQLRQDPQTKASRDVEEDEDSETDETSSVEAEVKGWEKLARVVLVDQSPLGKTPRSNPAVYIGAFDHIREFFAETEMARQRGLNASAFSFNSAQGQCERCRGAGFEKIEMQFLSDVFVRCPDCNGRRYRAHILDVTVAAQQGGGTTATSKSANRQAQVPGVIWSIADLLDATVDEVIDFLGRFPNSRHGARAIESLRLLQEAGLGYLRLGQPINTLSGGESQRLKLVSHLAEVREIASRPEPGGAPSADGKSILFIFDEPTTGLHFEDVGVLLKVFQRLVDIGHSVLVIEHNLDVIKSADWVVDLGPEAGEEGGWVVATGPPESIMASSASHTGKALRMVLPDGEAGKYELPDASAFDVARSSRPIYKR